LLLVLQLDWITFTPVGQKCGKLDKLIATPRTAMQNVNLTSYFLLLVLQLDWVTYTPTESSLRVFFANGKAHPKAAAQKGNFTY